jgi:hypothetical protein
VYCASSETYQRRQSPSEDFRNRASGSAGGLEGYTPNPNVDRVPGEIAWRKPCLIEFADQSSAVSGHAAARHDGRVYLLLDPRDKRDLMDQSVVVGQQMESNCVRKALRDEIAPKILSAMFSIQARYCQKMFSVFSSACLSSY